MQLRIKNFAKIKEANITIDGITVIAGENNTGKSTVGKILFSFFNSLSDIDDKILQERLKEIHSLIGTFLYSKANDPIFSRVVYQYNIPRRICRQLESYLKNSSEISADEIQNIIAKAIRPLIQSNRLNSSDEEFDIIFPLAKNISDILFLAKQNIALEAISRYFNNIFHGQINSLINGINEDAVIELKIKENENKLFFEKNSCKEFVDNFDITHKAIYIDDPFIIDELSTTNQLSPMDELLKNLLIDNTNKDILDGIIKTIRTKEKLNEIYDLLNHVVTGKIITEGNGDEFYLKSTDLNDSLSFYNLSAGMKAFVILKRLLEQGALKEKDVLILDEPEIHLHPQWQIKYAELIVLLQKYFDLSVLVTTHSPYFLDAIDLFSRKYNINDKVNYYLSFIAENTAKIDCVTGNIDRIYQKMASPIQLLDSLRVEIANK